MTQMLHHLSMLWLPRLGGILVPGAFASACGHCPSCPCPPLLGQRQQECAGKPGLPRHANESHGVRVTAAVSSQALRALLSCELKRCHSGLREMLPELCGAPIH